MIKRVHRGLFVHSMGFYEVIQSACKPCKGTAKLTLGIWTVFSKLLETCQATDHKLLMLSLTESLTKEIEKTKLDCAQQIESFSEKEAIMRQNINKLED